MTTPDPHAVVHVDWHMSEAEWDQLRESMLFFKDVVPIIQHLYKTGQLAAMGPAREEPEPYEEELTTVLIELSRSGGLRNYSSTTWQGLARDIIKRLRRQRLCIVMSGPGIPTWH
jgi:hypothetical protein